MKHAQLFIAKIRPEIYQLIESGEKTWEVRDHGFYTGDEENIIIQYVLPDGTLLGLWEADKSSRYVHCCEIDENGYLNTPADVARLKSGLSTANFIQLFNLTPDDYTYLETIRLTRKLASLADLLEMEEES